MRQPVLKSLESVARVSQGWCDDATVPAHWRRMSAQLHRFTVRLVKTQHVSPAQVRDVEALFCAICQRVRTKRPDCPRTLEHCELISTDP